MSIYSQPYVYFNSRTAASKSTVSNPDKTAVRESKSIFEKLGKKAENWQKNWKENNLRAKAEARMLTEVMLDMQKSRHPSRFKKPK